MEDSERETIINFNDADDHISIYTCHRGIIGCLDRMGLTPERKSRDGREYFVPRNFLSYSGKSIRIKNKEQSTRKELSQEQKELLTKRLMKGKRHSKSLE